MQWCLCFIKCKSTILFQKLSLGVGRLANSLQALGTVSQSSWVSNRSLQVPVPAVSTLPGHLFLQDWTPAWDHLREQPGKQLWQWDAGKVTTRWGHGPPWPDHGGPAWRTNLGTEGAAADVEIHPEADGGGGGEMLSEGWPLFSAVY